MLSYTFNVTSFFNIFSFMLYYHESAIIAAENKPIFTS